MTNVTVVGAGRTGRGFIGRLLSEHGDRIQFVDQDAALITALQRRGRFEVHFFGRQEHTVCVSDYQAATWETADFSNTTLIFVSVCGQNLPAVGKALRSRLLPDKHYYIITCENAQDPADVLKQAIGLPNVSVSEATVFCTTVEGENCDILSEQYPCLQCDAARLDGYTPEIPSIQPIWEFGNFLQRKLYTYNAASCIIAYLGWRKGYTDYGEAANDEEIGQLLDRNFAATNRALCQEYGYDEAEQAEFALLARKKFCDRSIRDTIERNARQPQRKLGASERIIGPMRLIEKYHDDHGVLAMTAAAMLLYDGPGEDEWRALRKEKTPEKILESLCLLPRESKLHRDILHYYKAFSSIGRRDVLTHKGMFE